jgi:hypothetical protein
VSNRGNPSITLERGNPSPPDIYSAAYIRETSDIYTGGGLPPPVLPGPTRVERQGHESYSQLPGPTCLAWPHLSGLAPPVWPGPTCLAWPHLSCASRGRVQCGRKTGQACLARRGADGAVRPGLATRVQCGLAWPPGCSAAWLGHRDAFALPGAPSPPLRYIWPGF